MKAADTMVRQRPACLRLCLFSVLALCFAACSSGQGTPVEQGNRNQILLIGNGSEPSGIDPHTTTGVPEADIQYALFEGLVSKHPQTLEPVPGVAERWSVSEDGLVYRFQLRRDARWSNGDPLTAADFVWSWRRALLPRLGNQYAYSLFVIEGAEAFHRGETDDFGKVGVAAIDASTLEVRLRSPTPYFLQLLDHHSTFPVPPPVVEAHGKPDDRASDWTRVGNFVGNGPFRLKEWASNKVLVVAKNEFYWDAEQISLNEIHFHPVEQLNAEERMFRAEQLHVTREVPAEKVGAYIDAKSPVLRVHPYFGTYFYRLNTNVKPLNDARVRKALALAIDRDLLVERVTKAGQAAAVTLVPRGTVGLPAETELEFDIERARQLLAEAGFPNGQGFPRLELLFNTSEDHRKIALSVQQMWKQYLNVDISLQNQDWKVFLANERTGNYQISRSSWIGDYLDPSTFLELFLTEGGNNKTGWSNADYDALVRQAAQTVDQDERYRLFQQAEQILLDELPIIPIYTYVNKRLVNESVQGWYDNVMNYHPYKYISLRDAGQ